MYQTTYHRPTSVDEAVKLASEDAKFISGGQTLIPTMKQRLAAPSDLIDLTHIAGLNGITVNGSTVTIAAATCHFDVANSEALKAVCPGLADLASHIGDPAVRHKGTIGGSIANNDPAADYPAGLLALDATIVTSTRELAASDFFTGLFETALDENEIVTEVRFDAPDKAAYSKFPNPASRYAMAGVFVAKGSNGVRVAVAGAGNDGVYRDGDMEAALGGNFSAAALDDVSVDASNMMSDMHASAEYRAALVKTMAKRAVQQFA